MASRHYSLLIAFASASFATLIHGMGTPPADHTGVDFNRGGVMPTCLEFQVRGFIRQAMDSCGTCAANGVACKDEGCCGGSLGNNQYLICKTPGCCFRLLGAKREGRIFAPVTARELSDSGIKLTDVGTCKNNSKLHENPSPVCPATCAVAVSNTGTYALNCPYGVSLPRVDQRFVPSGECHNGPKPSVAPKRIFAEGPGAGSGSERASTSNCFPGNMIVEIEGRGPTRMDKLAVGDRVKTGPHQYSPVFMFTHKLIDSESDFIEIETARGFNVWLTSGHYIYSSLSLVPASEIKVGSTVSLGNGELDRVVLVRSQRAIGMYNPQTENGNIVVGGIVASTYTTAIAPAVAHGLLAPARALYAKFGASSNAFSSGASSTFAQTVMGLLPMGTSLI